VKRKSQSSEDDPVRAAVVASEVVERSATFIVTVKPPGVIGLPSTRSISGPTDTEVKSAAGSFVVGWAAWPRRLKSETDSLPLLARVRSERRIGGNS